MIAENQTIKKTIAIRAPKEKVWEVLLQDKYTRIWFEAFGAGIQANTDWQLGSKAIFADAKGNGIVGTVRVHEPNAVISIEYHGLMVAGQEDYTGPEALAMQGFRETYKLTEVEGNTQLAIEVDMGPEYFDMMSKAWDKALEKIKDLAEE